MLLNRGSGFPRSEGKGFCRVDRRECPEKTLPFAEGKRENGEHLPNPHTKRKQHLTAWGGGNASFFPHDERGKSGTSGGGCGNCGKVKKLWKSAFREKSGGGRGKVAGKSFMATAGKVAGKAEAASKTHSREVWKSRGKRNAGTRCFVRERMAGEEVLRKNAGKMRGKNFFLFPFEI